MTISPGPLVAVAEIEGWCVSVAVDMGVLSVPISENDSRDMRIEALYEWRVILAQLGKYPPGLVNPWRLGRSGARLRLRPTDAVRVC
jgi:hypothetical protein